MFTRILVPTEGTAHEQHVLAAARVLAERERAPLVLVHVDPDATGDMARARATMLDMASVLRGAGVEARTEFAFGRTEEVIAEQARSHEADVILISPRRRPLVTALLDPGITTKLLRQAPVPLLIWPERLGPEVMEKLFGECAAPVIVPLDGSLEAERALPLAETYAREHNRVLVLAHVVVPTPSAGPDVSYPVSAATLEQPVKAGLRYLEKTRQRLAQDGSLDVQSMVLGGSAASELARLGESHPGSLMVMTTRGRGRMARMLLGSVAAELIGITTTPLLIIPSSYEVQAHKQEAERMPDETTGPKAAPAR